MKKHLVNVVALLASVIAGLLMVSWAMQQIDFMVSPLIRWHALEAEWWFPLKGWFGIRTTIPNAYVWMMYLLFLGWIVSVIGVFLSVWYWDDEK